MDMSALEARITRLEDIEAITAFVATMEPKQGCWLLF